MKCRLVLVLILVPILARPAPAGILFGRKKKPTPNERVPELVYTVKSDSDENKRARAAEELRQYDPNSFPYIVPILIDVLQNDKTPAVRAEAAHSLGKLRPVSQQAGMALEQALGNDTSMRVRLQARSSLMQYHWAGYRTPASTNPTKKNDSPLIPQTKEPPLAPEPTAPPARTTIEPPAAAPVGPPPARLTPQPAPSPLPPTQPPPAVIQPPAAPAPTPAPGGSGPDLSPPPG